VSQQYRICHNCGASLTPDQAYCPRCGAQYMEPIIQQPVVSPPPTSSPSYPPSYGQQAQMTPGQVGGSPQFPPPQTRRGVSPFLIIGLVVVGLLLLVGIGSLFYNLSQHNSSKPGTTPTPGITPTPTPGITPTPTPTPGITPTPTPTPGITPTATSFRAPASSTAEFSVSMGKASTISVHDILYNPQSGDKWTHVLCVRSASGVVKRT
jgi:hypothetical protein